MNSVYPKRTKAGAAGLVTPAFLIRLRGCVTLSRRLLYLLIENRAARFLGDAFRLAFRSFFRCIFFRKLFCKFFQYLAHRSRPVFVCLEKFHFVPFPTCIVSMRLA